MTKHDSFEKIYKNHYERLYNLAFRMTGNQKDSEDVIQTAFLKAYKAFEKFKNYSSIYTWLYRIVLNVAKDFYQEGRKLPVEVYSEEHNISQVEVYRYINSFGQVEDKALVNNLRENCLQMFMNCMPSKYRAVYTLRIILHCSVKETAEILEISQEQVKVNLHRARKITADHINERCSLIKPGSICDCRSYAKYLSENNKNHLLPDIEIIKNKEKIAVEEFEGEMDQIKQIEELYNTRVKAPDFSQFIKGLKQFARKNKIKLLQY